jgi:hypothetical protein
MYKNQENRKYLTMSLLAIIIVMVGTLAIGQILQTTLAQTTAGQIGQKVGQAAQKMAGQVMSGNQTANQTVGGGLKSKVGG